MAIKTIKGEAKVDGVPYPTFWSQADRLKDWTDLLGAQKCCEMLNQLAKERDSVKNAREKAKAFNDAKSASMARLISEGRIQIDQDTGEVTILPEASE